MCWFHYGKKANVRNKVLLLKEVDGSFDALHVGFASLATHRCCPMFDGSRSAFSEDVDLAGTAFGSFASPDSVKSLMIKW